jgi:hypothetical protein
MHAWLPSPCPLAQAHLHEVDKKVDNDKGWPQAGGWHAACLVVDLRPEQHQQRVGGEEEQTCQESGVSVRGWPCCGGRWRMHVGWWESTSH